MPLPHVAAGLPCKRGKREMRFVPKTAWATPWSSSGEGSTASSLPAVQQSKKRAKQLLPQWLQSPAGKENESSVFQFNKPLARHQENGVSHKSRPPLLSFCRFCVANLAGFLYKSKSRLTFLMRTRLHRVNFYFKEEDELKNAESKYMYKNFFRVYIPLQQIVQPGCV